jgi:endogenous inhibitor of DNA gyrase (YacG/DUF329 family)
MTTIDEFNASVSRYRRCLIWTVVGNVLVISVYLGLLLISRDLIRDACTRKLGGPAAEILAGLAPFPAVLVLFGSLWYVERRLLRDARLKCPNCGKQIVGMSHLVIASRNCFHCGRRVLREPDGNGG